MLIEIIFGSIIRLILSLIPVLPDSMSAGESFDITVLISFILKGFIVFPFDLFIQCISNVTGWLSIQMVWAIVEWAYKKIPGVN